MLSTSSLRVRHVAGLFLLSLATLLLELSLTLLRFLFICTGALRVCRGARLIRAVPATLFMCVTVAAIAQSEILTVDNWSVHDGDNPAWALPGFDDSQWAKFHMDNQHLPSGMRWYRATFQVPVGFENQQLALGMGPLQEVYDVYIDGTLVARYGSWQRQPHGPFPTHTVYRLPAGLVKGSIAHIAIRQWSGKVGILWLTFDLLGSFEFGHPPRIGPKAAIETQEQLDRMAGAVEEMPWDLASLFLLFAAAISFVLFSVQRRRVEYLYLGLYCLMWGGSFLVAVPLVADKSLMARAWPLVLIFALPILGDAFSVLFLAEICPRIRKILQVGAIILVVAAVVSSYAYGEQSGTAELIYSRTHFWCLGVCELLAVGALLLDRSLGSAAIALTLLLDLAAWYWHSRLIISAGPFSVYLPSLDNVLFVFVTLVVLFLRYRDEQARHAAIDQDLAAAHRMQEQLLAGGHKPPAGFAIEAIYRPAREVGGDFYRAVGLEDRSLLVILGDVSGKGLDAAMLVAVILGSLANETHRSPASLLEYLNRAVMGRTAGGFITACCARFYPDGRVVLANAGQISPYIDGSEVEVESGLPLGISTDASYTETEIMADGAVTFVSDGVVEARDAKGELLGFERMAPLTTKRAKEIADAAQRWGQEDDITVLTVERVAKLDVVAV